MKTRNESLINTKNLVYINQKTGIIMITKKQAIIFRQFAANIFKEYTLKELKAAAGERSNNAMAIAINKFKEEHLIIERSVGRSKLYSLNLENSLVPSYLALIGTESLPEKAKSAISLVRKEVEAYTSFFSIVVFGTYAEGKQSKSSDLDIAVLVEKDIKNIQMALKASEDKSLLRLDAHAISRKEFLEMLKTDEENLGKQIARKHIAVHNPEIFYSLLQQGVRNGFRI